MKKKILFVGFNDDLYFKKVQKNIIKLDKNKNKYFSLSWKNEDKNIFHISKTNFLYKNLIRQNLDYINLNISEEFNINKMEKEMLNLMVDRVNIKLLSSWQKNVYINLVFSYWINFFIKNKLSRIFFETAPHFPWEYALYLIAKQKKIKIYIIGRTRINDTLLVYSDINNIFKSAIKSKNLESFFPKKINLNELKNSELTNYSKKINRVKFALNVKKLINIRKIIYSWISPIIDKNFYFDINFFEFVFYKIKRIILRNNCKKWIEKNAIVLRQINKKYVIFFLQFRPERTSIPEGGVFYDQITAIRKLSYLLPSNYQILIKEHPRVFSDMFYKPDIRLLNFHKIEDYEIIKKIPKTKFIHYSSNVDNLIKKAQLVVSLTSSLNWDCLALNTQSLSFSETWYSICDSSAKFSKTYENKKKLLNLLKKDKKKINRSIKKFYRKIITKSIFGCPNEKIYKIKDQNYRLDAIKNLSYNLWKLI